MPFLSSIPLPTFRSLVSPLERMEETKGGRGPGGTKREREQHKQKKEIEKIKGAIKVFSHLILEMYNK